VGAGAATGGAASGVVLGRGDFGARRLWAATAARPAAGGLSFGLCTVGVRAFAGRAFALFAAALLRVTILAGFALRATCALFGFGLGFGFAFARTLAEPPRAFFLPGALAAFLGFAALRADRLFDPVVLFDLLFCATRTPPESSAARSIDAPGPATMAGHDTRKQEPVQRVAEGR
ncbi:MAG TPA: hypothetical protein VI942_05175, partial [Thermoanaerobaculia bacterium]|nr:hypothetical protein [Thermoanaerobaculia bacterium]